MNEMGMALLWGIYLLVGVASAMALIAPFSLPAPSTDFSSAGPRLVWMMLSFCLWIWGIWIERLRPFFAVSSLRPYPLEWSILAFLTLSALPYRAYFLTCCLLD